LKALRDAAATGVKTSTELSKSCCLVNQPAKPASPFPWASVPPSYQR
jgi:hypothetical protein